MLADQQGNHLSGATPDTAALFNQAVTAYNIYQGDPVTLLDNAIKQTPAFAVAYILKAYLYVVATEPAATVAAKTFVDTAKQLPLHERERSHINVLNILLKGNCTAAAIALDHHNVTYPLDLIGLQSGHLMNFYRARQARH